MTLLPRYIIKTIILAILLTTIIIAGVVFLMTVLGELKNMGEGDYGIMQALSYVLLRMPSEMYHFSPLILLLGSVIGLSVLSSYKELAVMRSSGFSIRRIMMSTLMAASIILVAAVAVGEWLAPTLSNTAEMNKASFRNGGQAVVTASGVWFHIGNNFIHVQHVLNHALFQGVTRYQFDDKHRLQAAYYAKSLTNENNQWVMKDVQKTVFTNNERARSQVEAKENWNLKFNPNLLNTGLIDPDEMSLPKLNRFANYLDKNGLQSSEYRYEFWQRVFQPFVSLTMILLAIPFVLGVLSTATQGSRIIMAFVVGFAFFILNSLLGQLCTVYQIPPALAASLPLAAFAVLSIYLTKKLTT